MLNKFSEGAQKIIVVSEGIAFDLGHKQVSTKHLLLSLIRNNTILTSILNNHHIDESMIMNHIQEPKYEHPPFYYEYTNEFKSLLEKSILISKQKQEKKVTINSICIALLEYQECEAYILLSSLIDIELIKHSMQETTKKHSVLDDIAELKNMNKYLKQHPTHIIHREHELQLLIEILSRKDKNNALIIGKSGVGKTALVEKLVMAINDGLVFQGYTVYELSLVSVVANTKYRGEFEEKLKKIIENVVKEEKVIIFIDEIHNVVGVGGAEGAIDGANILKPYLARAGFTCIGATTTKEYNKYFKKDEALKRRFSEILLEPTNKDETQAILEGVVEDYEKYHHIIFPRECLSYINELSEINYHNKHNPDHALDLLDLVMVQSKLKHIDINKNMIKDVYNHLYHIEEKYDSNAKIIKEELYGQDKQIDQLCHMMDSKYTLLQEEYKPKLVCLLVGPTGVGKTYLGKLIAKYYLNNNYIRLDLSEYSDITSVNKIIGTGPGYIGYDDESILMTYVKEHPHCLILLDEVEKAHSNVLKLFLNIFDEGIYINKYGEKIYFKDTYIILTSNAYSKTNTMGFVKGSNHIEECFPKEWLNRIDEIIYFNHIDYDSGMKIASSYLKKKCMVIGQDISFDNDFKLDHRELYLYGARYIHRCIKAYIYQMMT